VLGNDPQTNVALLRVAAPTLPMLTSCRRMLRSTQATRVGRSSIWRAKWSGSIGSHPPGATVKLEIVRDGKSREVEVNLGRRPDETDQARRLAPRGRRAEW